ncbi:MCE family protein [Pseudonocardiaceae bacterium YIM PH 21723]|nr:MCE family protein [Pseudonocardiaceae bacterium YIM PH 21723]
MSPVRHVRLGIAFALVLLTMATLAVLTFAGAFTRDLPVSLRADRAGLLMATGNPVKSRGVVVGQVTGVRIDGDRVLISLGLNPKQARRIPQDVRAELIPPTVFGPKFVNLIGGSGTPIDAGAVIERARVNVELNTGFDNAVRLLSTVRADRLAETLGAVASAVDGRGAELGQLIVQLNTFLKQINPSLAGLPLGTAAEVADQYRQVVPDLVTTADNFAVTADTVVTKKAELAAFLLSLTSLGNETAQLLSDNEKGLVDTLTVLRPTTRLLARYAPIFPCMFQGMANNRQLLEQAIGGKRPGLNVALSIGPGAQRYRYPADLPIIGANDGPDCHGLPRLSAPDPFHDYNTGVAPATNQSQDQSLADLLFGSRGGR